jgi:prophage maintenance system killer protein
MHYLSVHDLVWLNTTLTGAAQPYDYERLEACMASQYSYGDSTRTADQAANLLSAFLSKRPFAAGNLRTAFIALATFCSANGLALRLGDEAAASVFSRAASGEISSAQAVAELTEPANIGLRPGVTLRSVVTHLLNQHKDAVARLESGD